VIILVFNSCKKTESVAPTKVTASFTTDKENGESPLSIKFTNTSTNATIYLWDFGDGSVSSEITPTHIFSNKSTSNAINFTITLMATASDNTTSKYSKIITVNKSTTQTNNIIFNPAKTYGTMTDQEGNVYKTIIIGSQTWMAENLRTTKYNDGAIIPLVMDRNVWSGLSTGAYCTYKNTTNSDTSGILVRFYNWYAVNSGKLAPKGWHIPSDTEWKTLTTYLGGEILAGPKLKETGTSHWVTSYGVTNESGFTALPTGNIEPYDGTFRPSSYCYLWSSTALDDLNAIIRYMLDLSNDVRTFSALKKGGFAVRCLKD
jgi:uncharacterized protein (TIGR02145 family)